MARDWDCVMNSTYGVCRFKRNILQFKKIMCCCQEGKISFSFVKTAQ